MIVLDASAAILGLLNDGEARAVLAEEPVTCPHLVDPEVAQALRSQVRRGALRPAAAARLIGVWSQLGITRVGALGLLDRIWALRENLSAYDATYVALAEALEAPLVTADGRLARAPGLRCSVTVLRR